MAAVQAASTEFSARRHRRLVEELAYAWRSAPRNELTAWLGGVSTTFGQVTLRRGRNILKLIGRIGAGVADEIRRATEAHRLQTG